jgi:hypothetical protein
MNREELTSLVQSVISKTFSPRLKIDYHRYGLIKGVISPISSEDHEIIEIHKEITGKDVQKISIKLEYLSERYSKMMERRREY